MKEQGKINAAQRMRYLMFVMTLVCYVTHFLYTDEGVSSFFIPFTNWTLMLTTWSLWTSITASDDNVNFGNDALLTSEIAVYK